MRGDQPVGDDQPDIERPPPAPRGPTARTLLLAALLMVGVGYFLAIKLRDISRLQDCLQSGRSSCAQVSGSSP
jgi:hypothetical protein